MFPKLHVPPEAQLRTNKSNVLVALPVELEAVTVYLVEAFAWVGLPDNCPVEVLKVMPVGVAEIEYVAAPPVGFTVNPAVEPTSTV